MAFPAPVQQDPWSKVAVRIAVVAVAYIITGRLGLALADVQANVTLIWPPTGLSIAALVLFGPRLAIGVAIGAFSLNASMHSPLPASAAIALGNTLEALTAWALLKQFKFDASLSRMRDVLFLLLSVLIAACVSALGGVATLLQSGLIESSALAPVGLRWWAGNAAGGVILTPLVTVAAIGAPNWRALYSRFESWIVLAFLVGGSSLAFLIDIGGFLASALPLGLLVVLVWAGLRLGPRGAVIAGSISSIIAVIGTGQGLGPFADAQMSSRVLTLWAYVMTNGALALVLAAAVAEREAALKKVLAAERESRALEKQMQHVQRLESLGVLAGGVAHDFNNLLTAVRGNAYLVTVAKTDEERDECVQQIDLAAIRASELCQQLLAYSGKTRPQVECVNLEEMTREMRMLLRTSLDKSVTLELDFGESVPLVAGDSALLQQILLNLLMNASEAFSEASKAGTVSVSTELMTCSRDYLDSTFLPSDAPAGDYVALIVEDDGCGMSEETLQRVFDPFFSTKFAGRGLGLAAVVGVVRTHGGAIKVTSEVSKGTRFVVLLPRASSSEVVPAKAALTKLAISGRWLVVDDEDDVRITTASTLRSLGADVVEARDGAEAESIVNQERANLDGMLIDLTMPGTSGLDVIASVRATWPALPVILMSGYPSVSTIGDDTVFLAKPFSASEVVEAVNSATDAVRHARVSSKVG
jgi:signal transduction histidine kinase/ActR/RegA family two-component response regulator